MAREFARLTWPEVAAGDRTRTVALLPVGAIEAHGPHLPLDTDLVIAAAMARAAAARLEPGFEVWLLPALPYGAAPFAAAFPGTLSVAPAAVTELVAGIGRALAGRVACLGIANAHLDPAQLTALTAARQELSALLPVAWPNLVRRSLAERLGEEFRSGACHAGSFETSVVLAERPDDAVRSRAARLPALPVSLSTAIREGRRSFAEAGLPEAYCGDPAAASEAEGARTVQVLGEMLADEVKAVLAAAGVDPA